MAIQIVIRIETNNAAFGESAPEKYAEVVRMIEAHDWHAAVSAGRTTMRDLNGNTVGVVTSRETRS